MNETKTNRTKPNEPVLQSYYLTPDESRLVLANHLQDKRIKGKATVIKFNVQNDGLMISFAHDAS